MLLLIGTDALTLDQCDKLPMFLHHFKIHQQAAPQLTLLTLEQGHDIAHRVKDHITNSFPRFSDIMIHVEPDI
ncbi:MAG TPA: cation transporter dimerization domain-containing protein [Pedobacter sp.]|uniref:cation transporter dimerization domain-containing protein n=1 Tax=Pedobacter sp. TaxID=1411316 RepID=UPI002B84F0C1|nr:cation transporter dimerization domain-containing protein [Pedobacter sp.]HMI04052.1 cation transporter dimerization domain-containing protein [Pedobacter sp.]